jgi:hypothetical protein
MPPEVTDEASMNASVKPSERPFQLFCVGAAVRENEYLNVKAPGLEGHSVAVWNGCPPFARITDAAWW